MAIEDPVTTVTPEPTARLSTATRTISATQLAGVSVGIGSITLWLALLGLVTTPIMIRYLGATRYGVFALISIISAYLMNLEFGFGTATLRFLARAHATGDTKEQANVLGTSLAVFLVGGITAAALVFAGAPWIAQTFFHGPALLRPEATDAIRLGAVILLLAFLSSFASVSLQALARFRTVAITRVVFGTLASASAVAAVLVGGHLRLVLGAQAVVGAGLCVVLFVALWRAVGPEARPRIDRATFKMMAGYGAFILLSGLAYQLLLQGPPTVLAHLAPTAALAAFAVPNMILQQLVGVATSTSFGFMPFASAASVDHDRSHLAAVFRSNLRLTLLVIGPVAIYLAIFAHPLFATWISVRFAASASAPMRFLALAAVMLALSAVPADVVRGLGRPRVLVAYTTVAALIAIGTAIPLASSYRAGGAALALALALTVVTLPFIGLVAKGMLGIGFADLIMRFVRPAIALAALAAAFGLAIIASTSFLMALAAGLVGATLYPVAVFRFVLDDRERAALRRHWRGRGGKGKS